MIHPSFRYELKYIVDERCARGVRDFVRAYLKRDAHARPEMGHAYPIYSLYVDDRGLSLYHATVQAQKNRYKLRVRYYDHSPESPVFFEIKRRVGDVILKDRAAVRRASVGRLLARCAAREEDLADSGDAGSMFVLRRFCELYNALQAEPKIIVRYEREAWVSPHEDELRVTFDRQAAGASYNGEGLSPSRWTPAPMGGVVLELKFNDRFPLWMQELARSWDLYRTRMGKYVHCLDRLPRRTVRPASAFVPVLE